MAWVRIDDSFPDHPKVAQAGPLAMAMQVAAICYANRYLTDGMVPSRVVAGFMPTVCCDPESGDPITWRDVAQRLVDAGIWIEVEGGYQIHDYLEYQPSRADVEALRKKRAEAGRRGGQAKRKQSAKQGPEQNESKTEAKSNPKPKPNPKPNTQEIGINNVEPVGPTPLGSPKFGPGDVPYDLAVHLRAAILSRDPTTKVPEESPVGLARWARAADLMLRRDGRDPHEAAQLITWAQQDDFWCSNILSMDKFRQQYDRLKLQAQRASRGDPAADDPIARRRRMLALAKGGG